MVDDERPVHDRHLHPWAIVVSSVLTILLLVFVSFLCVGSKKNETEPSSKLVIANTCHCIIYLFFL